MTSLDDESNLEIGPEACAAQVMDTVPLVMRTIRCEVRSRRPEGLSVAQFRAMTFVNRRRSASVSDIASHLGLTLPSASKTVDGLVNRGYLTRETCKDDRRRLILQLTDLGQSTLDEARSHAVERISETLRKLPAEEREIVLQAMQVLRSVFAPGDAKPSN